jgi:hypothetical protein
LARLLVRNGKLKHLDAHLRDEQTKAWEPVDTAHFSTPAKLNGSDFFPDFPFTYSSATAPYIRNCVFESAGLND